MFNPDPFLERLRNDESLTDNLTDDEAEQLLAWAESCLEVASSEEGAELIIDDLRRLNREVGDGKEFGELFAALERK